MANGDPIHINVHDLVALDVDIPASDIFPEEDSFKDSKLAMVWHRLDGEQKEYAFTHIICLLRARRKAYEDRIRLDNHCIGAIGYFIERVNDEINHDKKMKAEYLEISNGRKVKVWVKK